MKEKTTESERTFVAKEAENERSVCWGEMIVGESGQECV
jgi:hypothetical protein